MSVKIHCPYDELVPLERLKPHPKNRNEHPEDQIERLSKILTYQGFRYPVKVSKLSGHITSGHGRVLAAKKLGLETVPVSFQEYTDETQEYADIIADNAIASWSELDLSGINQDVPDLGPDFEIDLLGIKDFVLEPADLDADNPYTAKIEIPVYEIKGDRPRIEELTDYKKTLELRDEINKTDLPKEVSDFLLAAAERHVVFNYEKIAEFYAHADKETQNLMEKSALVLIDFDKAIENGFVKMTKDISEAYPKHEN
jgi:hypothetical protein